MSASELKKECTMCSYIPLKPLTMANVAAFYVPVFGSVSYATLSVNVMNPSLLTKIVPSRDVTNFLLTSSVVGSGMYIYHRRHLHDAGMSFKMLYSGFDALIFNFGSVLLWAVLRTVSPKSNCIATIIGLLTSGGLMYTGYSYLKYIDDTASPSSSVTKWTETAWLFFFFFKSFNSLVCFVEWELRAQCWLLFVLLYEIYNKLNFLVIWIMTFFNCYSFLGYKQNLILLGLNCNLNKGGGINIFNFLQPFVMDNLYCYKDSLSLSLFYIEERVLIICCSYLIV